MPRFSRGALDHGRRVRRRAEPGRRGHGHRPQQPGQGAGPRSSDQRSQAQERDHVPRRRHGRLGDHRRPLLLRRRRRPSADGRLPFTGEQTTWSVKPGAGPTYLPDYVPDSAATGTAWSTGKKTIDERISQGPSTAVNVPGDNTRTRPCSSSPRSAAWPPATSRPPRSPTPPRPVLASHISQRGCQGPNDTRTTCTPETKAAGGLGLDRRAGGRPRHRRHPRRRQGPLRPDARRLDRRR